MPLIHTLRRACNLWQDFRFERSAFYRGIDSHPSDAVFILGCGRSGTTLLRAMLSRHPRLWGGPESWIFVQPIEPKTLAWKFGVDESAVRALLASSPTAVQFAGKFFDQCAHTAGKERWIEKTPRHVQCLAYLLSSFPRARFIHMIRDGRDVACSLRNHPKAAIRGNRVIPLQTNNPIQKCIRRWVDDTSAGLTYRGHPRLSEVRYEELALNPEPVVRRVCTFLGEDFTEKLLATEPTDTAKTQGDRARSPSNIMSFDSVTTSSIGRWKKDLSSSELATVMRIGGPLLEALGYAET